MLRAAKLIGVVLVATLLAGVGPANADGGYGAVDCDSRSHAAECSVAAGTPGTPGTGGEPGDNREDADTSAGPAGEPPCRYERMTRQGPRPSGAGPGAWYQRVCVRDGRVSTSPAVWLTDDEVADLETLAREAVSQLDLPPPAMRISPDSPIGVLVQVPVWLWVDESTWGLRRATASVPGMSVTATATPVRVVWDLGDGSPHVVCEGQGTPWRAGMDPEAFSACGHTYRRTSAGEPENTFTLRAFVTWTVSWAGGGTSGTVPPVTTTATLRRAVAQSQAVVAGPR